MSKFLTALLCLILLSACRKELDNRAFLHKVQLFSYENKAWNIAKGPNIYFVISDSITSAIYYSTRNNPVQNVSTSELPISWNLNKELPSSGHRFCLSFYNDESPGAQLMQSIYFYLHPPANLGAKATTTQLINAADTKAALTLEWSN